MKQTSSGKAFEYALAKAVSEATDAPLVINNESAIALSAYRNTSSDSCSIMDRAAAEAAIFLACHDSKLEHAKSVVLQPDKIGQSGDVRDIVITLDKGELGISAKSNHAAVKHSRLSDLIDFGKDWADYPVSSTYFDRVRPIFGQLRELKEDGKLFREVPNKESVVYLPVLTAFEDELKRLCIDFRGRFISKMFTYLLGTHDFYKVIKEDKEKVVVIQSMNMNGTLGWGRRWKIPNQIDDIKRKPNSNNTLLVSFAGGWLLSFRIHNASSKVEPSLKFDINFIGMPTSVARHEIPLV